MAFKTLFEHPIAGPRIFNERPALHELLPQLPSETLELLNDGSGVSRVAGARGLRSSALRHVETINWSQWATAVTLLIIFSLAISGIAFGVGYLVALT
ncbi:MAG: hypothetical protein EOO77_13705 [Oxalobacteraceae bacterium]|nr:MAG: hypothetical protein EOO77_13705 [Oxalobacteraceae bacterium]